MSLLNNRVIFSASDVGVASCGDNNIYVFEKEKGKVRLICARKLQNNRALSIKMGSEC